MRLLISALTALMLFATPVVAGDLEDAWAAYEAGDYVKAFRLFKSLAEQGNVDAQFNVGEMYDNGKGVPEDNAKAVYWYRKSAEQGDKWAQFNLGIKYDKGEGVPENDAKAVHWYRKAAEQGLARARLRLSLMYATGDGVPEDYVQAYAWSSIAAVQGEELAKKSQGLIKEQITPAQIAEAQKPRSYLPSFGESTSCRSRRTSREEYGGLSLTP
jgi:hypothetical protein